ncbi:hypothetical protein C7H19_06580 [Aphanothece hegewaldii CCALA 016]|uniref:Uncharacterized protein n=1 Tax=Aphanothece hegewaldii CCALA 016 TaxID=2107694 RepID=A0A2T1M0D4_9CHRO|nr:hypothetical protein [Aphanothece hegewaldii]PSF38131.1 hypothetical protein C7H19_06580 [Aphanothece hegewaldii CCALA 016]
MEPTEEQFLVFNALETLALIQGSLYDERRGYWYILTLSPILPISIILPSGEIVPLQFVQDDESI